jgi:hypothetical protein
VIGRPVERELRRRGRRNRRTDRRRSVERRSLVRPTSKFIGGDPALQGLSTVASEVTDRYRWDKVDAVVFVLTALAPPLTPTIAARHHGSEDDPHLKHITLEIDATQPRRRRRRLSP